MGMLHQPPLWFEAALLCSFDNEFAFHSGSDAISQMVERSIDLGDLGWAVLEQSDDIGLTQFIRRELAHVDELESVSS